MVNQSEWCMTGSPRPITRENHYVPQMLLRRWSIDGTTVFARRLLVSHPSVPEWQRTPFRGLARQRDLYTSLLSGEELDEFEQWASASIEAPASLAIDKVVAGVRLKREDWHNLAKLFALQDVRTPASFDEQMKRWEHSVPRLIEETTKKGLEELEQARAASRPPRSSVSSSDTDDGLTRLFRVAVQRPNHPEGLPLLRTEVTLGRGFWIASMRHVLSRTARVLTEHQWTIVESGDEGEWPLSDHPALKLNYGRDGYDFGGGWGRRNVDLMMPLSPRHLLFVEVGKDLGRRLMFTAEQAERMRSFLVERAHRWVFATEALEWVVQRRPRVIDAELFARESAMWADWHAGQSAVELPRTETL